MPAIVANIGIKAKAKAKAKDKAKDEAKVG
jgi:hypothetical protein